MEKREKIEQAVKERERVRLDTIPKKWNKREEYEFLRVLTGYGVDLQSGVAIPTPDWSRFRAIAKLDRKSDEALSDYYKVFIAMCKRQANVRLTEEEKGLEGIIEDISEDHARLILDRLELLSKLKEVGKTALNDERLNLCQNNLDTPDWWEPGKHDRELVRAVMKHGLYQSQQNIFIDHEFSFAASERAYLEMLEKQWILAQQAEAAKLLVKSEPVKVEPSTPTKESVKEEPEVIEIESESAKSESVSEDSKPETPKESTPTEEKEVEKEQTEEAQPTAETTTESDKPTEIEEDKPTVETEVEKEPSAEKTDVEMTPVDEKPSESDETPKMDEPIVEAKSPKSPVAQEQESEEKKGESVENVENKEATEEKPTDEPIAEVKSPKSPKAQEESDKDDTEVAADNSEPMDTSEAETPKSPEKLAESESTEKEAELSTVETDKETPETENADIEMAAEATEEEKVEKESPKDEEETVKSASPKPEATEQEPENTESVEKTETVESEKQETTTETAEAPAQEKSEEAEVKSPKPQEPIETDESAKVPADENAEIVEPKSPKLAEPEQPAAEKKESVAVVEEIKQEKEVESESIEKSEPKVEPVEDVKPILSPVKVEEKKEQDDNCVTIIDDDDDVMIVGKGDPDDDEVMHEKEKASIEKQNQQLAQLLQQTRMKFENPVKIRWFRDFALEKRVSHIVHCIEHSEWPVNKSYSAYAGCQGINLDVPLHETVKHMPPTIDLVGRSTPDLMSISGDLTSAKKMPSATVLPIPSPNTKYTNMQMPGIPTSGGKKRKRHIAIDVETERAKLHALLNSSQDSIPGSAPQTPVQSKQMNWPTEDDQKSAKRSLSAMQPPPAHQHQSHMGRSGSNQQQPPQQQAANYSKKSTMPQLIPGTSSTLTPIDLSSTLNLSSKPMKDLSSMKSGAIDLSEVQDFSISKKSAGGSPFGGGGGGKGKLDDMLTKLMKKNNYVSFA